MVKKFYADFFCLTLRSKFQKCSFREVTWQRKSCCLFLSYKSLFSFRDWGNLWHRSLWSINVAFLATWSKEEWKNFFPNREDTFFMGNQIHFQRKIQINLLTIRKTRLLSQLVETIPITSCNHHTHRHPRRIAVDCQILIRPQIAERVFVLSNSFLFGCLWFGERLFATGTKGTKTLHNSSSTGCSSAISVTWQQEWF